MIRAAYVPVCLKCKVVRNKVEEEGYGKGLTRSLRQEHPAEIVTKATEARRRNNIALSLAQVTVLTAAEGFATACRTRVHK